jgi:DNA-binding transcriptional regulator YiaG
VANTAKAEMTACVARKGSRRHQDMIDGLMSIPAGAYHYTESGLDNVWLCSGFHWADGPRGQQVMIERIDALQRSIGLLLVARKKHLSGKEHRFLRIEMQMSPAALATLLGVSEQAVVRWERSTTDQIPKPAEALVRALYRQHLDANDQTASRLRRMLQELAALEDKAEEIVLASKPPHRLWRSEMVAAA